MNVKSLSTTSTKVACALFLMPLTFLSTAVSAVDVTDTFSAQPSVDLELGFPQELPALSAENTTGLSLDLPRGFYNALGNLQRIDLLIKKFDVQGGATLERVPQAQERSDEIAYAFRFLDLDQLFGYEFDDYYIFRTKSWVCTAEEGCANVGEDYVSGLETSPYVASRVASNPQPNKGVSVAASARSLQQATYAGATLPFSLESGIREQREVAITQLSPRVQMEMDYSLVYTPRATCDYVTQAASAALDNFQPIPSQARLADVANSEYATWWRDAGPGTKANNLNLRDASYYLYGYAAGSRWRNTSAAGLADFFLGQSAANTELGLSAPFVAVGSNIAKATLTAGQAVLASQFGLPADTNFRADRNPGNTPGGTQGIASGFIEAFDGRQLLTACSGDYPSVAAVAARNVPAFGNVLYSPMFSMDGAFGNVPGRMSFYSSGTAGDSSSAAGTSTNIALDVEPLSTSGDHLLTVSPITGGTITSVVRLDSGGPATQILLANGDRLDLASASAAGASAVALPANTSTLTILNYSQGVDLMFRLANDEGLAALFVPAQRDESINVELVAAVLPSSRSIEVGTGASVFATVVNSGNTDAQACTITPIDFFEGSFSYQETNPATNAPIGAVSPTVAIASGALKTFVLNFTSTAALQSRDQRFAFSCDGATARPIRGVNTLSLLASTVPTADIIMLSATPSGDGVVSIPANGSGFFGLSSINIGSSERIELVANATNQAAQSSIFFCQTNPVTAECLAPPQQAPLVVESFNTGDTPTFSVFVSANSAIGFDPANNRIEMEVRDADTNESRGSTSVAVRTL